MSGVRVFTREPAAGRGAVTSGGKGGGDLRKLVEFRLLPAPVEADGPVVGEVPQIPERDAQAPSGARYLVGEAGAGQALPQVVEGGQGTSIRNGRMSAPEWSAPLVVG
jgi:hypothetical protein